MNKQQRRNAVVLTVAIFLLLAASAGAPLRTMALFEDRPVIQAGKTQVTTNDLLTLFTLIAGAATLATFFVTVIPQFKKRAII